MVQSFRGVVAFLAAGAALTFATPASALVNRAFASGKGADSATCGTVAAPCKTLQYVHDKILNPGGEIDLMGAGEYGPMTITKAITIVNKGPGVASVTQPTAGANAITIKAAAADVVFLEGLTIEGAWAADNGVVFQTGGSFQMNDCVVRRFKGAGVVAGTFAASSVVLSNVTVSETSVRGVTIATAGGLKAFMQGLTITNTQTGLEVAGGVWRGPPPGFALVSDSAITGTSKAIVTESTVSTLAPTLVLDRVIATGNGTGLATAAAKVRLMRSIIAGNGAGVSIRGSQIFSDGANSIVDNGANVSGGTITKVAPD